MRSVPVVEHPSSDEACRIVREEFGPTIALSFSRGKESIAVWLQLRRYFEDIRPFHRYVVPGLKFVDDSLAYYERFFGTKILRVPNIDFVNHLADQNFMDVEAADRMMDHLGIERLDDINDLARSAMKKLGLDSDTVWEGHGWRRSDSMARAFALKRLGPVQRDTRTLEAVYDWTEERLVRELKLSGCKLPVDYRMFGRSFDDIRCRFIWPIKHYFPEDYERIRRWFPLIDAELYRFRREPYPYR